MKGDIEDHKTLIEYHKWGTLRLARIKFKILTIPSPKIRPLARTMTGASSRPRKMRQYQLTAPPTARAKVNEGTLYMPNQISRVRAGSTLQLDLQK